jgi:CHAT domain-containing protein
MEAFLVAGARCVVASLWKVADAETAEMMQLFYQELKIGRSVGTALTLAKRQMIARYPSRPEVWASFQCYGDAGVTLL